MPIPTPVTAPGRAGLDAILGDPDHALLAFDYDGVLAPIVDDPENAPPHPGAVAALARLAPRVGTVVIITGRPAEVVVAYGQFADIPALSRLVIFGHYGRERWDAESGQVHTPPTPDSVAAAAAELPDLLTRLGAPAETWIEHKGGSVAVHTRRCPDPAATLAMLSSPIADCAARHGLVVEPGRLVLELRPPGVDKGQTLSAFARERGARSVCYIGDDLGDLKAFDAVESLREQGVAGLKVGSGSVEAAEVARRADLVVDGPAGVVDFLDAIADTLFASASSME